MKQVLAIALFLTYGASVYAACPGYKREDMGPADMSTDATRSLGAQPVGAAPAMDLGQTNASSEQLGDEDLVAGIFGEEIETTPEGTEEIEMEEKYD